MTAAPSITPAPYSTHTAIHPDPYHAATMSEHRNHVVEQRPYRSVQDFIPPRHSPSSYLPMGLHQHSVLSHDAPASSTPSSERSSPTRSSGRPRHRVNSSSQRLSWSQRAHRSFLISGFELFQFVNGNTLPG